MDEQFAMFVRSCLPELMRFGVAISGNPHDAEDLVQTALEGTGRRWRHVRAGGEPTAYVKRAMVNAHISRWRRLRREVLGDADGHEPAPAAVLPLAERELWVALSLLPPRQRAVMVLRYYEDLPEAEIAAVLGCAPGTVKSQASKAMVTLRRALTSGDDLPKETADERA